MKVQCFEQFIKILFECLKITISLVEFVAIEFVIHEKDLYSVKFQLIQALTENVKNENMYFNVLM